MSRIGDLIKRDDREPVTNAPEPKLEQESNRRSVLRSQESGDADNRGALPWLEPAPDDFDDDNLESEPLLSRKWLALGSLLFLALLAGVIYAVYKRSAGSQPEGVSVTTSGAASPDDPRIPLIEAPKASVRERPKTPGGMQVANIDKKIYDVSDGQIIEEDTQIASPPEQPIERPARLPDSPEVSKIPDVPVIAPSPTDIRPTAQARPVTAKPVIAKAAPIAKVEPVKPVVPKPAPVVASAGGVYLQLGAFSTRERAEAAWSGLSGKPGLSGLSMNIQEAGPAKFRLRAGPLGNRAAGDAACARLKASGQACLIAK
jgi:cell division protein FtsN